jgi:MFS family permease
MVGPIIAGSIAEKVGWRWFFWVCVIAQAVNILSLFFTFPETWRTEVVSDSNTSTSPQQLQEHETKTGTETDNAIGTRLEQVQTSGTFDEALGKGRPVRAQFMPWQPINSAAVKTLLHHIVTPIEIVVFPIVFWAACTMGMAATLLLAINLTQSQSLAAPPYNFTPQNVGFSSFALAAGASIGLFTAGPLSDWIAMRSTKRNNNIREPEMRLPALLPFSLLAIVAMLVRTTPLSLRIF